MQAFATDAFNAKLNLAINTAFPYYSDRESRESHRDPRRIDNLKDGDASFHNLCV